MVDGDYVGPFELNGFSYEEPPVGKKYFQVYMFKDGKIKYIGERHVLTENGKVRKSNYYVQVPKTYWLLIACLYAESSKHAIKIVNELRGHILADTAPLTNYEWKVC